MDDISVNGHKSAPHAVVIGMDNITGLETARIFHARGVPVIGFAKNEQHFCCKTSVCEKILPANTDTEELIEALIKLGPDLPQKAVLVPCTDTSVIVISNNRDKLSDWYKFKLPDADVVETLINKTNFYQYAIEHDLPIPATRYVSSIADVEAGKDSFTFPSIVKPPYRPEVWKANLKHKAFIVQDYTELAARVEQLLAYVDMLIVQDIIAGPDTNHVTGNCYYDENHQPVIVYTSRKIRQWPIGTGQGCSSESVLVKPVEDIMLKLFTGIGYAGLGYIEMKMDSRTGEYFIIEPNIGRPTGRSSAAEASGIELVYTMYCDALGWALPESKKQTAEGAKWFHLQKDLQASLVAFLSGSLSLGEWVKSMRGPKTFAVYDKKDMRPFWFSILHIFMQVPGKVKNLIRS